MGKKLVIAANTGIERAVKKWANSDGEGYGGGGKEALQSLVDHGCESGMVGELIYYTDTGKFYKKHKAEITALLKETLSDYGYKSAGEFLKGWDEDDIFADEETNQNLLAWWAFEQTAHNMLQQLEDGGDKRRSVRSSSVAAEARGCVRAARKQGWRGSSYDLTSFDIDYIEKRVGHKLTREELHEAARAAGVKGGGKRRHAKKSRGLRKVSKRTTSTKTTKKAKRPSAASLIAEVSRLLK